MILGRFTLHTLALALLFSCTHASRTEQTAARPAAVGSAAQSRAPASQEDPEEPLVLRLAQSAYDQDGMLACSYSALMISYLDSIPDQEVVQSLRDELREYRAFVEASAATATRKTKRVQRKVLRDLELLLAHNDPKGVVRSALEAPCKIALAVGGTIVRTTGLVGSVATSAITLPVRFVAKFGIGAFTRKRTPEKGPSFSQFIGKAGGAGRIPGIAYQVARTMLGVGSTFALTRVIVFAIDMEAARVCRSINAANPREVRFCENYRKLKAGEFQATEVGEKLGISVGHQAVHAFDFRGDERLNVRICEKSVRAQYRIARRAKLRLEKKLRDGGARDFAIDVVAPEIEGCISLRVIAGTESESEKLAFGSNGIVDGIAYTVVSRDDLPPVLAPPAHTDPVSDEEVCASIHRTQVYQQENRETLHELRSKTIQYAINPERYTPLVLTPVEIADERVKKQPLPEVGVGRNVLIVMAPTDEQREEYESIRPAYEEIVRKLKRAKKKLRKVARSRTYQECLKRVDETGFNFTEFRDLSDSVNAMTVAKRVEEFKMTRKEANRAGKRVYVFKILKRHWEFREAQTLNEVREVLTSPDVANVILLGHGERNGKILDTRNNELPIDALDWLSPSVLSLSFFSCHSETATANFRAADALRTQDSFHKLRFVGHVGASDFLEEREEAPILGLSNFVEAVDRGLADAMTGSQRVQTLGRARLAAYETPRTCEARLEGAKLSSAGSFGLQINSRWVGTVYPDSPASLAFRFPCAWLNSAGNNSASLTNQNLIEASRLASEEVRLFIDGAVVPRDEVIRSTEDASIRKIGFHW